jgi:hypothetical protein
LVAIFNLPIVAITAWLLWRSLDWPLIGDAAIFHFIANQLLLGAVPYRDIFDINMPLIYGVHAAVVLVGGMGDVAWRAFDLGAAAIMSALILMLVRPAGLAVAILAMLVMLATHLLLGPYAAGQRDFLVAILAAAAALTSTLAAEDTERRSLYVGTTGAFTMIAGTIKPSALLLIFLPALTIVRLQWRDVVWIAAGAAGVGFLVFGALGALGGLGAFITMLWELLPRYALLDKPTIAEMLRTCLGLGPMAGLAVAAFLGIAGPKPARARAMMGVTAFGLIHLLVQRKGYFYHVYPLGAGLACWGSWSLAALPTRRALVCLILIVSTFGWFVLQTLNRVEKYPELRAAAAMKIALESHLPRGARVQMLDSDRGAFLAMARAGMRQATPHIQSFSLILAEDRARAEFLAALETDPPAAMLLTNDFWPKRPGFESMDEWRDFKAFLTSHYDLRAAGQEDYIDWQFYLRRLSALDRQIR